MEFRAERAFPATLDNVVRSVSWVRESAATAELPPARSLHLELAVEKSAVNVVRHAGVGPSGEFRIRLSGRPGSVHVELEDGGIPFDPTRTGDVRSGRPGERGPGGHGIALIRRVTSGLSYRREEERNVLSFDLAVEA